MRRPIAVLVALGKDGCGKATSEGIRSDVACGQLAKGQVVSPSIPRRLEAGSRHVDSTWRLEKVPRTPCGARRDFEPGNRTLLCPDCGHTVEIESGDYYQSYQRETGCEHLRITPHGFERHLLISGYCVQTVTPYWQSSYSVPRYRPSYYLPPLRPR